MTTHDELADHLDGGATGDVEAFMRFYDATSGCAFGLALTRAWARGLRGTAARAFAERELLDGYVRAWLPCAEQRASGLSPLAWFLALPAATSRDPGVACA